MGMTKLAEIGDPTVDTDADADIGVGIESRPRRGIGRCMCCQQPLRMRAGTGVMADLLV